MTSRDLIIWQVAAGSAGRSYADDFFRHGVALLGPADPGPWTSTRGDDDYEGTFVRRFASEVAAGDIVVLRAGRSRLLAVGLFVGDYLHDETFGDVLGWDLQHVRRVRRFALPTPHDFEEAAFGSNPARFGRVQNEVVRDYVARILASPMDAWQCGTLPPLPAEEPDLPSSPAWLRDHLALVNDLLPIWGNDATFGLSPAALAQAAGYVKGLDLAADIVVTDGFRYRLYSRAHDYQPIAYANLWRMEKSAAALFQRLVRRSRMQEHMSASSTRPWPIGLSPSTAGLACGRPTPCPKLLVRNIARPRSSSRPVVPERHV